MKISDVILAMLVFAALTLPLAFYPGIGDVGSNVSSSYASVIAKLNASYSDLNTVVNSSSTSGFDSPIEMAAFAFSLSYALVLSVAKTFLYLPSMLWDIANLMFNGIDGMAREVLSPEDYIAFHSLFENLRGIVLLIGGFIVMGVIVSFVVGREF